MSDHSAKNVWAAISALAAVTTIVVTIVLWSLSQDEPNDSASDQSASASAGESSPDAAGTEAAQGSGDWDAIDSYTVHLPTTFQGHECESLHLDLDDGGRGETLGGEVEATGATDLVWYSCGGSEPGHFYSATEASGSTPSGGSLDPDLCNSATSGDSYLALSVDLDDPPTEHGCLITTSGALAGVSPTDLDRAGDGVVADLQVVLWQRAG